MSKKNLTEVCKSFSGQSVAVVGDLMLDEYTWGSVDRISPEAPVVVVKVSEESFRAGGAGNVVSNIAELGGLARIVGLVGNDEAGKKLLSRLESRGVDTSLLVVDDSQKTTTKTRVIAHNQQVVRVDRENLNPIGQSAKKKLCDNLKIAAAECKSLVISDYGKGVWCEETFSSFQKARSNGSISNTCKVVIDPKPKQAALYNGGWIITPNCREAEELSGEQIGSVDQAVKAAQIILKRIKTQKILVTLGNKGMVLVDRDKGLEGAIDTVAREVFDVSGAGDTVCATLALGLAAGEDALTAAKLANIAAGVVVAEVGTVAVTQNKLLAALEDLN